MFQITKTYDFAYNNVVIGPVIVEGYGDDGGLEYEEVEAEGEMAYGVDGEATFSRYNTDGLIVTITLKETSNSIAELDALRREQRQQRKIQPLPYTHRDEITGDKVASGYAVFLNHATPSKAKQAGEREFRIHLPYATRNTVEGATNIIPV